MIENILSNERIEELLDAGIEHESLDYKEKFDPRKTHDIVELAKDIAAMANTKGGYLVIGVNKNFERVGIEHELKLDEAEIRTINCCNHLSCGQKRFPLFELIFALEFKPQDLILEPWYF